MKFVLYIFLSATFFFSQVFAQELVKLSITSDTLFCGHKVTFTKTNPNDTISIYYSFDNINWNKITDNFPSTFEWIVPFTLKNKIYIKTQQTKIQPPQLLWEVPNAHNGEIRTIDFSWDGKLLLTLGKDGFLKVWDIQKRLAIDSIRIIGTDYFYDAKFLKNSNKIVFSLQDNIVLWNRQTKSTDIFYTLGNFIRKIDVNPTNNNFSIITDDVNLAVFNESFFLPIPINIRTMPKTQYANAYDVKYFYRGGLVAIATYNGKVITSDGGNENSYTVDNKPIYSATFTHRPDIIAFGGASNQLGFYEINGKTTKVEPKFSQSIREIKFSPTRNEIYAASLDSTLRIWSSIDFKYIPYFITEPYAILSIDLTTTSDTIATTGRNNSFRVWQNYKDIGKTQIDSFHCFQEIFISVAPSKETLLAGEYNQFNLIANSNYKDTLKKLGLWKIQARVYFPFMSLHSYVYTDKLSNNFYVFEIDTNLKFYNETIAQWKFKSLFNNYQTENVKIENLKIIPPDNFYPIVLDNNISTEFVCKTKTIVEFEKIPKIQQIIFENDQISINFDTPVLNNFEIIASDPLGNSLEIVSNGQSSIRIRTNSSKYLLVKLKNDIFDLTFKIVN